MSFGDEAEEDEEAVEEANKVSTWYTEVRDFSSTEIPLGVR